MPIRLSGMNSGLDTDSIIKELMSAQSTKKTNLVKAQTSLQWKQDAWKSLNTKIYNLYNKTISNLKFSDAYSKKTTSASNSSAVSVVTGSSAVNGTQTLSIESVAKSGYLTGASLDGNYTSNTKISAIKGMESLGDGTSLSVKTGGNTTEISITSSTTIADVVSQLKSAGVNASFDEKNQRFFISSKLAGANNDFSIAASDSTGYQVLDKLGLNVSLAEDTASLKEYTAYAKYKTDGYTGDAWNELIKRESDKRVSAYVESNTKIDASIKEYQEKIDKLRNADMPGFTLGEKTSAEYGDQIVTISDRIAELEANAENLTDEEKEELATKKNQLQDLTSWQKATQDYESYRKNINDLNAQKAENDSYLVSSTDEAGNVTYSANQKLTDEVETAQKQKAEFASSIMEQYNAGTLSTSKATKIAGEDASITLNGATFTSTTNTFDINGLTINVKDVTAAGEKITLTTGDDYEDTYNTIKNFIKEYNELINEMDKLYNASSAKNYKPLTAEEKEAMTDTEIEEWEKKIKDSLLRKDSTLSSVSSVLTDAMSMGYTVNGKTYYLSDFGISTLGYFDSADNEKHAYHIDGDSDDSNTSGKADVLKSLISSDPSLVQSFFTQLAGNIYDKLFEKMQSTDYSSIYKVYDDKKMEKDYKDYSTKIAAQEARLKTLEDRYYKQFTAMETALAKLNSSQSAITSLLGGGS